MKSIDRRSMLKATGVGLALPLLDAMHPACGASTVQPPTRMIFVCTTLGLHGPNLWPKTEGAEYETTPYLKLIDEHRGQFTLFSGLQHEDQTGRQPHDSEMTWLSAARKPGVGGFRNTISVDQLATQQVGDHTRFRSISLGTLKPQSQSYTNGGVMIPSQTSPAELFSRLFLKGSPQQLRAQRQRLKEGKSILDQLQSQSQSLGRKVGPEDNHLLNDYYQSVRDAETRLLEAESWLDKPKPKVDLDPPNDIADPADLIGKTRLMIDLIPLIVQTDSTRVISLMVQDHFVVPKVDGVTGNHHNLSHHGQDKSKIEQLAKIESGIVGCYGEFLSQMRAQPEGDSNLLDNSMILFGSNLGNANAHDARNLPILLAGGRFQHVGYCKQPEGTPLCDLFLRMLQEIEVEVDSFGQSRGVLSW